MPMCMLMVPAVLWGQTCQPGTSSWGSTLLSAVFSATAWSRAFFLLSVLERMRWISSCVACVRNWNGTRHWVSDWILTSCQPHRVTSGQSNSAISKCTFQNSSDKPFLKSVHKTNPYTNMKQNIHIQTSKTNFRSPFNITYTNIKNKLL